MNTGNDTGFFKSLLSSGKRRGNAANGRIALVSGVSEAQWCSWQAGHDVYEGILQRSYELGYKVEFFYIEEQGLSRLKLADAIRSRGIEGIIFGNFNNNGDLSDQDFSDFSLVGTCISLFGPRVHSVRTDYTYNIRSILYEIDQLGYKRPGMITAAADDEYNDRLWIAGMLDYQFQIEAGRRIPPLCEGERTQEDIYKWYKEYTPDIMIVDGLNDMIWIRDAIKELNEQPIYVSMSGGDDNLPYMGILTDRKLVGSRAVELLVGQMHRGEKGVPDNPSSTLIQGKWYNNYTAVSDATKLTWLHPTPKNVPVSPWDV